MALMVEMNCTCDATFTIDTKDNEDAAWLLVWRFANAHAEKCGYMTNPPTEDSLLAHAVEKVRVIKKASAVQDEDDEEEED